MKIISVAIGLVFNKGKILLIQESKNEFREKWFLPGGRVEEHENILDSLKREIREEANIKVNIESLFYFDESKINNNNDEIYKRYRFYFICSTDDFSEKESEDEHSMRSKWILIDDVDKYDLRSPFLADLLKKYKPSTHKLGIDNFVVV